MAYSSVLLRPLAFEIACGKTCKKYVREKECIVETSSAWGSFYVLARLKGALLDFLCHVKKNKKRKKSIWSIFEDPRQQYGHLKAF